MSYKDTSFPMTDYAHIGQFALKWDFFFMHLLSTFTLQILENLLDNWMLWKWICTKRTFFFGKTNNMTFKYLLPPFIMQNLKMILGAGLQLICIQEPIIFGPNSPQNGPLPPNQNFAWFINSIFLFYLLPSSIIENREKKRKLQKWISRKLMISKIFNLSHHRLPHHL